MTKETLVDKFLTRFKEDCDELWLDVDEERIDFEGYISREKLQKILEDLK